ncbi:MAG: FtsB family cell division protein [Candidatus Puniceispirillales bacterium WSBS_2018_MAG_OTU23]
MRFINHQSKVFVFLVTTFLLCGYFIIHGLGLGNDKGYLSISKLDTQIILASSELTGLRKHRQWLQHRVSLIAEDEVDQDFLGEIARAQGGLYAVDELVIDFN